MSEEISRRYFKFVRNIIALPYIIFAIIMMLILLFAPKLLWFVAIIGVFMIYHVTATFVTFLFKYMKTSLVMLIMTLCVVGVFAVLLNAFFSTPI